MARICERLPSNISELAQRLIELTYRLCTGGEITAAYVREKYGVSRATASRCLVHLERAHIPVQVELQPRISNDPRPRKVLRLKEEA